MGDERWLGLETRHLVALATVAREGSFSGAADALGYVQSAISQQIAQLERLVGTKVLERDRGSGPVALTPAGRVLLRHADELLSLYDEARDAVDHVTAGAGATTVRVGVVPSVAARALPALVTALADASADAAVEPVTADDGVALADLLAAGAVDLALGDLPAAASEIEGVVVEPVLEDRFVALVALGSPLARGAEPLGPRELGALRLVGTVPSPAQDTVTAWLTDAGATPSYVVRCPVDTAIQPLVAAGLGVAVLPALAVAPDRPGTVVRELDDAPAPRAIALAYRGDRADDAPALVEHARAALRAASA